MPKLTSVKNCHVCGSLDLIPIYQVPIPDLYTDEDVLRNVLKCGECDTLHYIDNYGEVAYEFSVKVNKTIEKLIIKKDKPVIYEEE